MAYPVLGRSEDALDAEETTGFLRRRLGDGLLATTEEYGTYTVDVAPDAWVDALTLCRDEDLLAYDMFDCLFGVDAGEDGFDVVAILYSTSRGRRIVLRGRCEGGRETPTFPTATGLFPGANWMERETWDMFGIEFTDHPGLAPRILCVENFEGWPLRKDFFLASRAAKPWPGVKEPAETDEDGNVITKVPGPGEAPGPSVLDELMAGQSKAANPAPEEPVGTPRDDVLETAPATEAQAEADEDAVAPTEPDHVAADVEDAAEQAAVRAEEVRRTQAEARAEKAAEHVDAADAADAPVVPEGTPPTADADEEDEA